MLRSLKEVQGDDSVVGFYQVTALGAFFNQTLIDTQAIYQDRLRQGGIVVVHGELAYYLVFYLLLSMCPETCNKQRRETRLSVLSASPRHF